MHKMLVIKPADFPPLLKEIPPRDLPKKIYYQGKLPDSNFKFLAVVGARRYSPYGKEVCERLIAALRGYPVVIVSGLALGIDGIAHRAALDANLPTIAVPGSGLNRSVLYPRSHRNLAEKILENGGALLSEFEPDFAATPWSFPQRNRIMAGLCHATLIIEAEKKSGTMITARLSSEYNRDVCVVPGDIFSKNSEGPHLLMRLGATPITKKEDLIEVLGFETNANTQQQNLFNDCSEVEIEILNLLNVPMQSDELLQNTGKGPSELNALLSLLELKGYISLSSGYWRKKI